METNETRLCVTHAIRVRLALFTESLSERFKECYLYSCQRLWVPVRVVFQLFVSYCRDLK